MRARLTNFIETLEQGRKDLDKLPLRQALEDCIETLSKVRNHGNGKNNKGIILLDQFFAVPQIGEVIRDMLVLQHMAINMDR